MKHGIRSALVSVGLAGVVMAVTLAPGGATPPSGLTNTLLASGTNQSEGPSRSSSGRTWCLPRSRSPRAGPPVGTRIPEARS